MDDPKALITVAGGIISNFLIFEIADSQNEDRLQGMYYIWILDRMQLPESLDY